MKGMVLNQLSNKQKLFLDVSFKIGSLDKKYQAAVANGLISICANMSGTLTTTMAEENLQRPRILF